LIYSSYLCSVINQTEEIKMKIKLTSEQSNKLQKLWDEYKEVVNKYSFEDWNWGDLVPSGVKRSKTIRFNKYLKYAKELGYDMMCSLPPQMNPNN